MSDDEVRFMVPPPGRTVRVHSLDDAVDLAFLAQTTTDALVACLDHRRNVVVVAETGRGALVGIAEKVALLPRVDAAVVLTSDLVSEVASEDDVLAWHRLDHEFARSGLTLIDWIHVDETHVRSLAETVEGRMRWRRAS